MVANPSSLALTPIPLARAHLSPCRQTLRPIEGAMRDLALDSEFTRDATPPSQASYLAPFKPFKQEACIPLEVMRKMRLRGSEG